MSEIIKTWQQVPDAGKMVEYCSCNAELSDDMEQELGICNDCR